MIPTIIIGTVFAGYVVWAFNSSRKSMTSNKCSGCAAGCSQAQKKDCHT